jgi:hypothetical protein
MFTKAGLQMVSPVIYNDPDKLKKAIKVRLHTYPLSSLKLKQKIGS